MKISDMADALARSEVVRVYLWHDGREHVVFFGQFGDMPMKVADKRFISFQPGKKGSYYHEFMVFE